MELKRRDVIGAVVLGVVLVALIVVIVVAALPN
jgi:Co/Zn/Cd efflux system component